MILKFAKYSHNYIRYQVEAYTLIFNMYHSKAFLQNIIPVE